MRKSSSQRVRLGEMDSAREINASVVLPIADTTTTTLHPERTVCAMRLATLRIPAVSETEEPPYF